MSTMEYVKPEHWDKQIQRVADKYCSVDEDYFEVNRMLDELDLFVRSSYNEYRRSRKLSELPPEVLKGKIRFFLTGEKDQGEEKKQKREVTILEYYQSFVHRRSRQASLSVNSISGEKSSLKHFATFYNGLDESVNFKKVNLRFFERYRDYLWNFKPAPADSTIHKHLRRLKEVCTYGAANGIEMGSDIKSIKITAHLRLSPAPRETIALYLPKLAHLENSDFSARPALKQTRDLFLIACFTGFRFNRWSEITGKNIKEQNGKKVLEVFTKKGRAKKVVIPLNPTVEKIMEGYNWTLPKLNEGQVFNRNLKELCQLAGFTETVKFTQNIRGRSVIFEKTKYELIITHTARRTFATNAYESGMALEDIASLTGHSDIKTLKRYIKEDQKRRTERIGRAKFFKLAEQGERTN